MARLLIGASALLLALTLFPGRCGDPARYAGSHGAGKRKRGATRTILWVDPTEPRYRG
jgi:hypothetical protein